MKKILTIFIFILLSNGLFAKENQEKQELTVYDQLKECINSHPDYSEAQKEVLKKYIEQLENEVEYIKKERQRRFWKLSLLDRLFNSQTGW